MEVLPLVRVGEEPFRVMCRDLWKAFSPFSDVTVFSMAAFLNSAQVFAWPGERRG